MEQASWPQPRSASRLPSPRRAEQAGSGAWKGARVDQPRGQVALHRLADHPVVAEDPQPVGQGRGRRGGAVYPGAMHAVTIVDGALQWREHPDPQPGPGEVLVTVAAAGVNAADLLQRRGLYPAPVGSPADIPGLEFAGAVAALGPGAGRFSVGDRVRGLGADRVIEPGDVADHGPYDVSLELVGAPGVAAVLPLLATGGRIVVIGVGAGAKLELNLLALMGSRATIGGSTLRSRSADDKAAVARAVEEHALPLLVDGSVAVPVAERVPMAAADHAYESFAAGGKLGKIVLVNE